MDASSPAAHFRSRADRPSLPLVLLVAALAVLAIPLAALLG